MRLKLQSATTEDAEAIAVGAGPFYAKCGWRETGRATHREIPLVYYERSLGKAPKAAACRL